jgi:flagellar hook-basal body complex protein FliE
MSSQLAISSQAAESLFARLKDVRKETVSQTSQESSPAGGASQSGKMSFFDQLQARVAEVNENSKAADKMASDVVTGKSENLHEAMLAASTAELTFNLMVQVRNRALEAYQEVMRMPV